MPNTYTPHCWKHLVFVQPPRTIQTFHQYLDEMYLFEAIFKMFGMAVQQEQQSHAAHAYMYKT